MAEAYDFKRLYAAIDNTPIIDNHAHPLLKPGPMKERSLLSIATEANGNALEDSRYSLAHIRATKHLSRVLGCEEYWEAVEESIEEKRATDPDAWTRRCLEGITQILIDDGLDMPDQVESYSWHDTFVKSKCKRIVRIEAVAEDVLALYCDGALTDQEGHDMYWFTDEFETRIRDAIDDPEVVGFKSIICYRGGLDISRSEEVLAAVAEKALMEIRDGHLSGERPIHLNKRLQDSSLNHMIVHITARLISNSSSSHKKPIQFHTGLGDNDINLTKSSPSHLQPFIREYPTVPIVILHGSYPWMREAGYLAAMYKNVYADIGEVFPFINRQGQESVVREMLELCPWSKILWSTDGHWFPETYLLAVIQVRSILKTVLSELVRTQQLTEREAVRLVHDVLCLNSKRLYKVKLESSLPSYAKLDSYPPTASLGNTSVVGKLRTFEEAKFLRVYWHDYTSSARCRVIPMKQVYKVLESGKPFTLSITKASLGLLQTDVMIPQINASGAYTLYPDWSTLKRGPADGHISCYGEFRGDDGSEVDLCPRTVLRKTLKKAAEHELEFLIGWEIEFVVMGRNPDPTSSDKYRMLENDGHAWSAARVLADWGREGSFSTAIEDIIESLDRAGVDVELFHPESAPGQYELVLAALPPMEACDTLLHARQILESATARHGFRMTLHPKPFAAACGSASHIHLSVSSLGGDNPAVYEPFYAGILRHFRAIIAITYSNPTSYERMVDSFWAGGRWVMWGTENKEAPLRKCKDSHWEMKVIDGLANPYFAVAALLAAGTDGILNKASMTWKDCVEDPAKLNAAHRKNLGIVELFPADLREALEALEQDTELTNLLNPSFARRYIDVKNAELGVLEPMSDEERRRWVLERY